MTPRTCWICGRALESPDQDATERVAMCPKCKNIHMNLKSDTVLKMQDALKEE